MTPTGFCIFGWVSFRWQQLFFLHIFMQRPFMVSTNIEPLLIKQLPSKSSNIYSNSEREDWPH